MITNPFARKPKTPIDQALDAFDGARSDAADYAATIRDAAADIADTLVEIGPPTPKGRKVPIIAAAVAAGLGLAFVLRSKLSGGSSTEQFPPPVAQPATDTAARTTAQPQDSGPKVAATATQEPKEPKIVVADTSAEQQVAPTATEEPKEPKAATTESDVPEKG